jgi:hypothetical protein
MQSDLYLAGISSYSLVDTVIYDFLGQVIGPGGIGIHTRALTNRLQSTQYLDIRSVIGITHCA